MKKSVLIVSLCFLLFCGGTVFAILSGFINVAGTANLSANVEMRFANYGGGSPSWSAIPSAKGSTGTATIMDAGQTLQVTADVIVPGDSIRIPYIIRNTGSSPAIIQTITPAGVVSPLKVTVHSVGILNVNVPPGTLTAEGWIEVEWLAIPGDFTEGSYDFTVKFDYIMGS